MVVSGSIWCHQRHPSWGFELKNVVCYHSIPDESGSNLVRTSRWVRISSGQSSDTFQSKTSVAQRSLPVLTPLFISWQNGRDRIVVSTSRCGRDNPGSNPGHGRGCEVSIMACWSAFLNVCDTPWYTVVSYFNVFVFVYTMSYSVRFKESIRILMILI